MEYRGGYRHVGQLDEEALREYNAEDEQMEKMILDYKDEKVRYGQPPEGPTQRRRTKLKKKVILTHGNLVLDLPVPSTLRLGVTREVPEEMQSVRYMLRGCHYPNEH